MKCIVRLSPLILALFIGCSENDEKRALEGPRGVPEGPRGVPDGPRGPVIVKAAEAQVVVAQDAKIVKDQEPKVVKAEPAKSVPAAGKAERMKVIPNLPPLFHDEFVARYKEEPKGIFFCSKNETFFMYLNHQHLIYMNQKTGRWLPGHPMGESK